MLDTVFSRSRLGEQTFPGGTTYEEYLAAQEQSGAMDELKAGILPGVRSQFLEYGLSGETYDKYEGPVNLDNYFGPSSPVFLQPGEYDAAKEAYKREQDGTATQDDIDLLARVRDPDGPIMKRIARLSGNDPTGVLQQGYLETGGFPQNLMTGEIVLPEEVKAMQLPIVGTVGDVPENIPGTNFVENIPLLGNIIPNGLNYNRIEARERSEQALELQTFLSDNIQTPRDPVIRTALDQVINADMLGILAERMYNLADITEEGVEHYLPRLTHWATNYNLTTENTFGLLSAENYITDEDVAADLAQVRALSTFADRGAVLNDLLRKQVRDIVGEEAFNESIYAIKDEVTYETADGRTVTKEEYRHNFVSESFAEQFFEAALNSKGMLDKMAIFVLENVGAGYAIRAPFAVAGTAVRTTARAASDVPFLSRGALGTAPRFISKDGKIITKAQADELGEGEYMALPYAAQYMDTPTLVKYTEQYAKFRGIPFTTAARQLQRQTRAESMLVNATIGTLVGTGPMRGGRLAAVADAGQGKAALKEAADTASKGVNTAKDRLFKAIDEGDNAGVINAAFDLRTARARQNWAVTRTAINGARDFGFSPGFDTAIALSQALYREVSPETGPISDFYAATAVMGALTIKRGFDIRGGIPFVSSMAATGMYNVKTVTEDAAAYVFGNLAAMRTGRGLSTDAQDAIKEAGAARAYGTLTPPGLRNLLAMSPDEVAKLPVATRRMLQNFSTGMFRGLAPDDRNALLLDMDEGMADLQNVLKPFYTLTDSQGNRVFSDAQIRELEVNMSLNLGQLSGMGFLLSVQRQQQAQNSGVLMGHLMNFKRKISEGIKMQKTSEKQVAGMAAASELLDAQIMQLRSEDLSMLSEGEKLARQVALDNLETFAGQFRKAASEGRRQLDELLTMDARDAAQTIDDLTQPENAKLLDAAFVSGELDLLLSRIALSERRAQSVAREGAGVADTPADKASDFVELTSKQLADRRKIEVVEDRLSAAVAMIRDASIKALDKGRPSQTAAEVSANQSTLIQQVVKLERTNSDLIIEDAYGKVSTNINIPIVSFGNSLDRMFRTYAEDKNASFLSFVNPSTLKALGGKTGERLFIDLDSAAARSIDMWFGSRSEAINTKFKRFGRVFEDGASFREFMKEQIVKSDPEAAKLLNVTDPTQISDLQLAYYMAQPNKLKVSAQDLQMVTSPMELETFRQAANKMIGSNDPAKQALGSQLRQEVDRAFENWATSTGSVDEYNQVVIARTVYRAEQLRFEGKATFGGTVESVDTSAQLTGDVTASRDLGFVLNPFVQAITAPGQGSISKVKTEISKIVNTIAPVSHSLMEQKLVKNIGPDGKIVAPTDEELAGMVTRTVDLDTYETMKGLLGNAVRNAFYGSSDMSRVRYTLDNGQIPGLVPGDAPKRIEVPAEYEGDVRRYLKDMEDASIITVETVDGPKQMKLLDMEDLIMADRQIDVVVNSIPEFRAAHKDLLTLAKNAQDDLATAAKREQAGADQLAKVEAKLPDSFSGQGFLKNVLGSDAPDESRVFLQQLQTSKAFRAMSPEQQNLAMQSLFVDTIKTLGGYGPSNRSVRLFDGSTVVTGAYNNPAEVFAILDDALVGASKEGVALKRLADAAGIQPEQLETLHSLFRMSVRINQSDLLARNADGKLTSVTKGFTLDNALSKAFNLARGMVSKEYVMAEVAIRYAALAKGKSLDFLLSDPKSATIVKQLLEDDTLVADEDAYYFATQLMKYVADEVPRGVLDADVESNAYLEEYYISLGVMQPVDVGEVVFNQ